MCAVVRADAVPDPAAGAAPAPAYRRCTRCVMDTTDPDIVFDGEGVCGHCRAYDVRARNELFLDEAGQEKLRRMVEIVKRAGRDKPYDCIIGVSGGLDSTMTAYTVKRLGLRPLAIHLDNGWDSELAVKNIENLVRRLGIDLQTMVLDWEEFRDLHLAYLKAGISNSEAATDHAIVACMYQAAVQHHLRYIFSGGNIVMEAIMPPSWGYDAKDWKSVSAIHRAFGSIPLTTYPRMALAHWVWYTFVKGIKFIPILNYVRYHKRESVELLDREIGYTYYGAKHFESVYTRFFQGHILPVKFNIDKRKAHFSTLICSGQMTREEALRELERPTYAPDQIEADREYVIKKLGLTEAEWEDIMARPPRSHRDFPNHELFFSRLKFLLRFAKKVATWT